MPAPPGGELPQRGKRLGGTPVRRQGRECLQSALDNLQVWDRQFHGDLPQKGHFLRGSINPDHLQVRPRQGQDHRRGAHAGSQVHHPCPRGEGNQEGQQDSGIQQELLSPDSRREGCQGVRPVPPIE